MAVQPGAMQYMLAGLTRNICMILQHNFVLRQCAGFIGAQNIHRAEVLNRIKVLHDNFRFESFTAPRARVEVTIIGNISGVSPTATESANSAASHQSPFV